MKVVSNAGPLIALGKLGQLGLLLKLYNEILIPSAVYEEVVINGLRLGAFEAQVVDRLVRQGYIQVVNVTLPVALPTWAESIDIGEIQVILLAQQQSADWALIDNAHARRAARQVGVPLKGTIGLLLESYRRGYLTLKEFELLIQEIQARPELWISERLCEWALARARQEAE
jgi:predicted nucleic acid-binding protein